MLGIAHETLLWQRDPATESGNLMAAARDARLRLTFTRDGGMEGYLSGYSPIEAM